jgi:hypothetical protein
MEKDTLVPSITFNLMLVVYNIIGHLFLTAVITTVKATREMEVINSFFVKS